MATQDRHPSEDVTDQQVRRARWQGWALVVGGLLVVVGLCLLLVAAGVPVPSSSAQPPAGLTVAGFAVTAVGFAIAGVGIYRMARAGMYDARTRAALTSFTRAQRRDAVRLVRQGQPVPEGALGVARVMAVTMARARRADLLYVGIAVSGVGTMLRTTSPWWMTLIALSAITLVAVAIPLVGRDARLAQRWLEAHPHGATSQSASC